MAEDFVVAKDGGTHNESDYVKDRVATVQKLLGRGEVKIVEGTDHITTLTKPKFASAVIEFLRSGKPK